MRTAIYVDGFNLFHSLLENRKGVKWLDLEAMAAGALSSQNRICLVRYFTARVTGSVADPDKPSRQDVYIRALRARGVIIHEGNFTERTKTRRLVNPPPPPGSKYVEVWHREEKGSDVNLAVHLLNDAWRNTMDCAVVVSNDSDLAEACHMARALGKVVGLLCPIANRPTVQLKDNTNFQRHITQTHLLNSQLPNPVIDPKTGREIRRPARWV